MKTFSSFLVICLFIWGCSHSGARQRLILHGNGRDLRPAHEKYYFELSTTTKAISTLNGETSKSKNDAVMGFIYTFHHDSSGQINVQLTYDKMQLHLTGNNRDVTINAEQNSNSTDPVEKILSSFMGSSVHIQLDKKGNIRGISGSREILEKVNAQLTGYDDKSRKMIQDQVFRMVGEPHVQENFNQSFKILPDSGIAVGDSWEVESTKNFDLPLGARSKYTLESVNGPLVKISSSGNLKSINDQSSSTIMGNKIISKLAGQEQGEYQVNVDTGIIMEASSSSTVEGTLQVLNQTVPLKITVDNRIKSKAI